MKEVEAYRKHARDCEAMAARLTRDDDKRAMLMIAAAWNKVADEREAMLQQRKAS